MMGKLRSVQFRDGFDDESVPLPLCAVLLNNNIKSTLPEMASLLKPSHSRITRLKLMKDLKYGKVHLRQSLLELSEFSDIDRIFKDKKQTYKIQDQDVMIDRAKTQEKEEETPNLLISPADKIEIYKKEKMNKKLKQKMELQYMVKPVGVTRPRVPKTSKMLTKFENKYKNEMPISYKQQLRESELNLEKIKKNNKTTFEFNATPQKPLYQSRMNRSMTSASQTSASLEQSSNSRKRFISLMTGMPEKDKYKYLSIRELMQGRVNQKSTGPIIDIKGIESSLDKYLNHAIRVRSQKEQHRNAGYHSPGKNKSQVTYYNQNAESKPKNTKQNAERSFTRSQQTSKKIIDTMTNFYETKHQKIHSFDTMFKNLKYDRPLTSSIRRRNYIVLGKQSLNPITEYRQISEQERSRIRQQNHSFYCKLIQGLEYYSEQDIPTTVYIIEEVKRIFESEYLFTRAILNELINDVACMRKDAKMEEVLSALVQYVEGSGDTEGGQSRAQGRQK